MNSVSSVRDAVRFFELRLDATNAASAAGNHIKREQQTSNHSRQLEAQRCISQASHLLAKASLAANYAESTHEFSFRNTPVRIGNGLDGCLSRQRGFLCRQESQRRLPSEFRSWEQIHQRLPTLIRQGRVRHEINSLPQLTEKLDELPYQYLTRASLILSALAHAYFFALREDERDVKLPSDIDEAWVKVCQRLGRPFTGRVVADDILNNVQTNGSKRFQLSSPVFDTTEERLSSGLQGFMESEFAPALTIMGEAQNYVLAKDNECLTSCLERLTAIIVRCAKIFQEITPQASTEETFDPVIWIKSYPAMGNAVRTGELGNSGADVPLFHALDAFVGREKKEGDLRGMQMERRETLPRSIQAFLKALEDPVVSVRNYVEASSSARLKAAFDGMVQVYLWFLEWHRVKAVGITGVSLASGRHKTSSGVKSDGREKKKKKKKKKKNNNTKTGPPISPVQMLSRQMKAGMVSRLGKREPWQVATVKNILPGGHCDQVTIEFHAALPLEPGDRVQVFPENDSKEVGEALAALHSRFGQSHVPSKENLARRDLSKLDDLLGRQHVTTLKDIVDNIPAHKPRFYSVSGIEPNDEGLTKTAVLTIGHGDGDNSGVTVKFLRSRQCGDETRVVLYPCPRFNLPSDDSAPLVLVGQGSGIGPLVGFIRARARLDPSKHRIGKMMMFIGTRCLNRVNCLDELLECSRKLPLTIKLAITHGENATIEGGVCRSQPGVSSRVTRAIEEEHATIQTLLEKGGHVFVCGSTEFGMTVRKALDKAPKVQPHTLAREMTPRGPTNWRYYHEDLFGHRGETPSRAISTAELALHNTFDDCWTCLNGVVYDMAEYLALHPGGSKVIMESAGTTCDERFYETHGDAQEVIGRLGPYAIGRLVDPIDFGKEAQKAVETTVRAQNALTNNTAFCPDRHVPFYAYCDALIVFAETGLDRWRSILSPTESSAVEIAQKSLLHRFLELKAKCWKDLGETPANMLEAKEDEVRERYLYEAAIMHELLDGFKSSFIWVA